MTPRSLSLRQRPPIFLQCPREWLPLRSNDIVSTTTDSHCPAYGRDGVRCMGSRLRMAAASRFSAEPPCPLSRHRIILQSRAVLRVSCRDCSGGALVCSAAQASHPPLGRHHQPNPLPVAYARPDGTHRLDCCRGGRAHRPVGRPAYPPSVATCCSGGRAAAPRRRRAPRVAQARIRARSPLPLAHRTLGCRLRTAHGCRLGLYRRCARVCPGSFLRLTSRLHLHLCRLVTLLCLQRVSSDSHSLRLACHAALHRPACFGRHRRSARPL